MKHMNRDGVRMTNSRVNMTGVLLTFIYFHFCFPLLLREVSCSWLERTRFVLGKDVLEIFVNFSLKQKGHVSIEIRYLEHSRV